MLLARNQDGRLVNLAVETCHDVQVFTCPACHRPVRARCGKIIRPHFAHYQAQACSFFTENESDEHLSLKAKLYQSLSRDCPVQIEAILPKINQIADLLVADNLVLEVQCSRLSLERLRHRTKSYRDSGYQVRWLLGEKLWLKDTLSALQQQFLYFSNNMGFHLWELDEKASLLRLKYLIYQDVKGKVHYLEKSCSFAADILGFLRQPYLKQGLSCYQRVMDPSIVTYIQNQLYHNNPKWLKKQEKAYLKGENLLAKSVEDFYPQIRPLISKDGFCQIEMDLSEFYQAFTNYYIGVKNKNQQILYPPAFYLV
ncbi:competence protein CoiA [Streptococcus sp. sy004]|uniref:competence protein CoiA n=1 Tax=Streptococcus sp. sy004 TaxID=2600149 RepID=UPI0011B7E6A8|nr:competence protein CoiA family protein [Streptococcus sp. sy004]TWT12411.1 competence protein CoiA [Streptococcus sp. sy004]